MIKRALLINPPSSHYGTMFHYTKKLGEAFESLGFHIKILPGEWVQSPEKIIKEIILFAPSFTLSFNGLLPNRSGNFLSDLVEVPHVAYLIDSPTRFMPLIKSQFTLIASIDRFLTDYVQAFGFKRACFCPAAIESDIKIRKGKPFEHDVVMLASCIDYEAIYDHWKNLYPQQTIDALMHAVEITLSETKISYIQALIQSLQENGIDLKTVPLQILFIEIEDYIRAKERVDLMNVIEGKIDIWGRSLGKKDWKEYLQKAKGEITIHPPIPYPETLKILQKSKILISSSPSFKMGIHMRVLAALGSGCLPAASENPFIQEAFEDGKDLILYRYGQWNRLNQEIHSFLDNSERLEEAVQKGREKTLTNHIWTKRAEILIQCVDTMF